MCFSLCPSCHPPSPNRRSEHNRWRKVWRRKLWRRKLWRKQLLRWRLRHQRHEQQLLRWKGQRHVPRPDEQEPVLRVQRRENLLPALCRRPGLRQLLFLLQLVLRLKSQVDRFTVGTLLGSVLHLFSVRSHAGCETLSFLNSSYQKAKTNKHICVSTLFSVECRICINQNRSVFTTSVKLFFNRHNVQYVYFPLNIHKRYAQHIKQYENKRCFVYKSIFSMATRSHNHYICFVNFKTYDV